MPVYPNASPAFEPRVTTVVFTPGNVVVHFTPLLSTPVARLKTVRLVVRLAMQNPMAGLNVRPLYIVLDHEDSRMKWLSRAFGCPCGNLLPTARPIPYPRSSSIDVLELRNGSEVLSGWAYTGTELVGFGC